MTTSDNSDFPTPSDETQWLAFRYVLDEMTAEEREAFEHSLEDDPNRCESVAIAVQLVQAIADSETSDQPMIASSDADSLRVRLGFIGASLLACVVVITLWLIPQPRRIAELQPQFDPPRNSADRKPGKPDEQTHLEQVDDSRAGQLLSFWTRSKFEIEPAEVESSDEWTELVESTDTDIEAGHEFGWMLAAVSKDAKTSADPRSPSIEN